MALARSILLLSLSVAGCAAARIAVRPARGPLDELYQKSTGNRFSPQGFNYIVLAGTPSGHSTFDTGIYDSAAADAALGRMRDLGYNAVRVFLDDRGYVAPGQYGLAGPRDTQGVYGPYVDNLVNFLTRAWLGGFYTIVTLNRVPDNDYFQAIFNQGQQPGVDGENALYLTAGGVAAHAELARRVVQAVADRNRNALTWVLAWELDNEISVHTDQLPFSQTSGTITTGDGKSYDLADPAQRLACMDSNFDNWVDQSAAAIRAVDAEALVSQSVFTYHAVGRSTVGPVPCQQPCDVRAPPRPVALRQGTTLSFVDIHAYPTGGNYTLAADLASSEVGSPAFFRTRQPFLMGEFGAFKSFFSSAQTAANVMLYHREQGTLAGYIGSLFWAWDTTYQPELWSASDASFTIANALAPALIERTRSASTGRHGVHFAGFAQPGLSGDGIRLRVDKQLAHSGWTALFVCDLGGQAVLATSRWCGQKPKTPSQLLWQGPIGAISPSPQSGASPVYDCQKTLPGGVIDRYFSPDFLCEGGTRLGILGYAPDH